MRPNRPGEPDTGKPYVRFDEGRSGNAALTTAVSSIRHSPLRLLYAAASTMARTRVRVPPVELDGSRPTAPCLSRRKAGRGKQLGN